MSHVSALACRSPMRILLLCFSLFALPCFAEAGLAQTFCGMQSCSCGASTCGCGQVCNFGTQQCQSAQAGFCSHDSNCAATCGQFICEGNVCVAGVRDGGTADAGTSTGGNEPRGCSSAGGSLASLGLLLLLSARAASRRPATPSRPAGDAPSR